MASEIHYGTGRRKTSTARVFIQKGKGKIVVNKKPHHYRNNIFNYLSSMKKRNSFVYINTTPLKKQWLNQNKTVHRDKVWMMI